MDTEQPTGPVTEDIAILCPVCGVKSTGTTPKSARKAAYNHWYRVHNQAKPAKKSKALAVDRIGRVVCDICRRSFKSQPALRMHRMRRHPESFPQRVGPVCKTCGFIAKNEQALQIHHWRKHTKRGQAASQAATNNFKGKSGKYDRNARVKRKYTRRAPVAPAAPAQPTALSIQFCPRCGCNIRAVALAVNMTE